MKVVVEDSKFSPIAFPVLIKPSLLSPSYNIGSTFGEVSSSNKKEKPEQQQDHGESEDEESATHFRTDNGYVNTHTCPDLGIMSVCGC